MIRQHRPDETTSLLAPLTDDGRAGLCSSEAFTPRRCQVLLASADGLPPSQTAERFGCASQGVRNAIIAFAAEVIHCLRGKSHAAVSVRSEMDDAACERLHALPHRSTRDFGKPSSLWTATAADVAFAEGIIDRPVSDETIIQVPTRLGVGRQRAKIWITGPAPAYLRETG